VQNLYLSVDPYMRRRMDDVESYVPPFELDRPMDGGAIGVLLASRADGIALGDHVRHGFGWREYAVLEPWLTTAVDSNATSLSAYAEIEDVALAGPH
jgi:NADPH-dependent curcumin reductase CurA